MKFRTSWVYTAALAATLACGALLASGVRPASAETLKGAHFVSPQHPIGIGFQAFADALKKDSNGKLRAHIFAGESLLGAKAISDGIRDDVADFGQVVMTYTPAYYPHGIMINNMAMIGDDDMAAAFAVTELYWLHCKACQKEFARQNQVFVVGGSTAPYVIIAKGDLNSPEKIKGAKLRAGGSLWDRFAESIGAVGVNIPTSEMYEGMSRGILTGALYAVGGLKSLGVADVAHQVIMLNTGSFRALALFSFNHDKWAKFTPQERTAIFKAASTAVVATVNAYHHTDDVGLALAKKKNIAVVQPDPGLVKMRDQFVEHDITNVVAHAKEKLGIDDAAAFVAQYRELYAKYAKLIAPVENQPDKLSAILYQQVYAKLDPKTAGVQE